MKHSDFDVLLEETVAKIKELSVKKGGEYAGDDDRLENFKRNATRLGLHPLTIWAVYVNKHIDAINQYVADIQSGKTRERMESIEGRFDDAMLYFALGKAIVVENKKMLQMHGTFQPLPNQHGIVRFTSPEDNETPRKS